MTRTELINQIKNDLGANFNATDTNVLLDILEDVIIDALNFSGRLNKVDLNDEESLEKPLTLLSSNIKSAVKSIYLQRGTEDVKQNSVNGVSGTYQDAIEKMRNDIYKSGKRVLR